VRGHSMYEAAYLCLQPLYLGAQAWLTAHMDLRGKWVLVTGASAGLGHSLAQKLATEHGANLVVTARRAERLDALKTQLEAAANVQVVPLVGDMARAEDVERLLSEATAGRQLSAAILNAGITHLGRHDELQWQAFLALLQINVTANVRLASELAKHMQAHQLGGAIMLVSSLAGVMPVPFQSAYSGTKAFLNAFGVGLAHELKGSKVSVTVFAPGGIATEMTATDRFAPLSKWLAPVETVADEALAALQRRDELAVPGFLNRLGVFAFRLVPRSFAVGQLARTYRKALAQAAK
jgi:uncharacterized protein